MRHRFPVHPSILVSFSVSPNRERGRGSTVLAVSYHPVFLPASLCSSVFKKVIVLVTLLLCTSLLFPPENSQCRYAPEPLRPPPPALDVRCPLFVSAVRLFVFWRASSVHFIEQRRSRLQRYSPPQINRGAQRAHRSLRTPSHVA